MSRFRLGYILFLIVLGQSLFAQEFVADGFSKEQELALSDAVKEAQLKTLECDYLSINYRWLQKKMVKSFENNVLKFKLDRDAYKKDNFECAHTNPSYFFAGSKIILSPVAFKPACYGLGWIVFHEMIHLNWTFFGSEKLGWGDEDTVYKISEECFSQPLKQGELFSEK